MQLDKKIEELQKEKQIALLQQEIEKIKNKYERKGEEYTSYTFSSYPYSSCASANYPYYEERDPLLFTLK